MGVLEAKRLDPNVPQKVSYCIPLWLRDEQIRLNTAAVPGRLLPAATLHPEPIAVVCYGPSLSETWPQIRDFQYVLSCSGAHKFLIERGIVPTWHVDVDPREHKIQLIGTPHPDVEYLLASTCHPKYFQLLRDGGHHVKLWHVFDAQKEALRVLPPGEWALTGGCSVGLRALAIARFLGFRQMDVFGMDGNEGPTGKHAAAHPSQSPTHALVDYGGRTWRTTQGFYEAARQTAHELDDLSDVTARFHGDGLVQAMMRDYTRTPKAPTQMLAFTKPELISDDYRQLNARLHADNLAYGVGGGKHADAVKKLVATLKRADGFPLAVLDYGCGKGYLAKALPFPMYEYDPAIPAKAESPRPADLVVCSDVLEHIEPDKLLYVLDDLKRCVQQVGYFVIHTGPAKKTLPDGRNTHLIQRDHVWWERQLGAFFAIGKIFDVGPELHVLVGPATKKPDAAKFLSVMRASELLPASDYALRLGSMQFRTDPYLIGGGPAILGDTVYADLCASFPPLRLFKPLTGKFSLSSVNGADQYAAFLGANDVWHRFHKAVKDPGFIEQVRRVLAPHGVDLGPSKALKARWEFSVLAADGGYLAPHTDLPSKVVTLVIGMPTADPWEAQWGGGTDVLALKDQIGPAPADYAAPREAFDVVTTYPYRPNHGVLFVKTAQSWHSVGPLTGPASAERRTVTINIERKP